MLLNGLVIFQPVKDVVHLRVIDKAPVLQVDSFEAHTLNIFHVHTTEAKSNLNFCRG
jgi:hypothetical protein